MGEGSGRLLRMSIRTQDYHTAGEPFRIVIDGAPDLPGASVRERRAYVQSHADADVVRQLLCFVGTARSP